MLEPATDAALTRLKLVDRQKDCVMTAGGKNVSPAQVENAAAREPVQ
jgi:long-subunit acyl-CoA synthetase (AMP-forming)